MARPVGEKLTEIAGVLTFGLGLTALFMGVSQWWLIFIIGWFVVTPLLSILFDKSEAERAVRETVTQEVTESVEAAVSGSDERGTRTTRAGSAAQDREDALSLLRERYARGELDHHEFERMVEHLLETETIEDAESLFETGRGDIASTDRELEPDPERT